MITLTDSIIRSKTVISGSRVEFFRYEIPKDIPLNKRRMTERAKKTWTEEDYLKKRHRELRSRIIRYIECNQDLRRFITITYKENIQDLTESHKQFKAFIRRIRKVHKDLNYIAVPELQKRGAVHYHMLTNLPYMKLNALRAFRKLWTHGSINIKPVYDDVSLSAYMSKYISKDLSGDKFRNRKKYFISEGIKQPIVLYDHQAEKYIADRQFYLKHLFSDTIRLYGSYFLDLVIYRLIEKITVKSDNLYSFIRSFNSSFLPSRNEEAVSNFSP